MGFKRFIGFISFIGVLGFQGFRVQGVWIWGCLGLRAFRVGGFRPGTWGLEFRGCLRLRAGKFQPTETSSL